MRQMYLVFFDEELSLAEWLILGMQHPLPFLEFIDILFCDQHCNEHHFGKCTVKKHKSVFKLMLETLGNPILKQSFFFFKTTVDNSKSNF